MEMKMTPIRQKEIADIITKYGFELSEFSFKPMGESTFELSFNGDNNIKMRAYMPKQRDYERCEFSPGNYGKVQSDVIAVQWSEKLGYLANWIEAIFANYLAGDPWADLASHNNEQIHIGDDNQERFSEEDIDFVDKKLDIILEALKEFASDISRIKEDLDYLKSAGNNVSKKDWGLMVMGNVMGWAMSSAIPKESIGDVWSIIVQNLESQNLLG